MSSHHIIRDEQEPSMFIFALKPEHWKIVLQLLEWSPTVVINESALDEFHALGHKIDIALISDKDTISWRKKLAVQEPVEIYQIAVSNSIRKAFEILRERGNRAVNILCDNPSLIFVIKECLTWIDTLDIVIYSEDQRHILNRTQSFKKWLPDFSEISIMPLREDSYVYTEGFDLNPNDEKLAEGLELKKRREGEVLIRMSKAPFMISERLE